MVYGNEDARELCVYDAKRVTCSHSVTVAQCGGCSADPFTDADLAELGGQD